MNQLKLDPNLIKSNELDNHQNQLDNHQLKKKEEELEVFFDTEEEEEPTSSMNTKTIQPQLQQLPKRKARKQVVSYKEYSTDDSSNEQDNLIKRTKIDKPNGSNEKINYDSETEENSELSDEENSELSNEENSELSDEENSELSNELIKKSKRSMKSSNLKKKEDKKRDRYSVNELVEMKKIYESNKNKFSFHETHLLFDSMDKICNKKYVYREKGARSIKFRLFKMKEKSVEEIENYVYIHNKNDPNNKIYKLEEKRLIKQLVENLLFNEKNENYNLIIDQFIQLKEESDYNGLNGFDKIGDDLRDKIDEIDWNSIADEVNLEFNNQRNGDKLKLYYLRFLMKWYDEELEEKSRNNFSEENKKVLIKAYKTLRDPKTNRPDFKRIYELFPNLKPRVIQWSYKNIVNNLMKIDEKEDIDLVPQTDFALTFLGEHNLRNVRRNILNSIDSSESIKEVSSENNMKISETSEKYRYMKSSSKLNNKCKYDLCPVRDEKKTMKSHLKNDHNLNSKLPQVAIDTIDEVKKGNKKFKENGVLYQKAKEIIKSFSRSRMKKRDDQPIYKSYVLIQIENEKSINVLDDESKMKRFYNANRYYGQSLFKNREKENFVYTIIYKELGINDVPFKSEKLLEGKWIAIEIDTSLTKNESILLEHIGINLRLKNTLNSMSTADNSIYDELTDEENLTLSTYVLLRMWYKFKNNEAVEIDINDLREKSKFLVSILKNFEFRNYHEVDETLRQSLSRACVTIDYESETNTKKIDVEELNLEVNRLKVELKKEKEKRIETEEQLSILMFETKLKDVTNHQK